MRMEHILQLITAISILKNNYTAKKTTVSNLKLLMLKVSKKVDRWRLVLDNMKLTSPVASVLNSLENLKITYQKLSFNLVKLI